MQLNLMLDTLTPVSLISTFIVNIFDFLLNNIKAEFMYRLGAGGVPRPPPLEKGRRK